MFTDLAILDINTDIIAGALENDPLILLDNISRLSTADDFFFQHTLRDVSRLFCLCFCRMFCPSLELN